MNFQIFQKGEHEFILICKYDRLFTEGRFQLHFWPAECIGFGEVLVSSLSHLTRLWLLYMEIALALCIDKCS